MRVLWILLLISGMALGQAADTQKPDSAAASSPASTAAAATPNPAPAAASDPNVVTIPAGTKIPLFLAQAISTKNAREGDAVYATTAFPFVVDNRVVIPAGSYIQGKISHVERGGRLKGRAEILMHFTSMIYPRSEFPFVVDNRVVIPAGSYIQGKISHVERGGRLKGRAEILMHFTSMIYP